MSAIETVSESSGNSTKSGWEAALEGIAQATSFYDLENAWVTGLRAARASEHSGARDQVLMAAGRRLHALGGIA